MAQVGAWGPFGALNTGAKIWGDKVDRVTPPPLSIFSSPSNYIFIFVTVELNFIVRETKGAHPCTSSSGQGGGKRVLEDFF